MKKIIFFIIGLFLLLNCNAEKNYFSTPEMEKSYTYSEEANGNYEKSKDEDYNINKNENLQIQRKIIKNGKINIDVKDIKEAEKNINESLKKFDGYISSSSLYTNYGTIVVKVPAEKFDDYVNIITSFGKITYKSITTEDVTRKYYDLEKRIETKKILQQRYTSYLKNATKVEELLNIEKELNNVTAEIESLELEFKNLSHLISFSTLTIDLSVPGKEEIIRYFPSFKKAFINLGYNIVNFLYVLLFIIIYLIIFGIPILFIIAFLYFITFGKIGLVKKLFKKLSGK